jgi:hypothetical protein
MTVVYDQGDRSGPAAAGEASAKRAEMRDVIEHLFGTLDGQCKGVVFPLLDFYELLKPLFAQRTGRETIDSLGGKGDQFPFDEGLDRAMYDVADIVRGM